MTMLVFTVTVIHRMLPRIHYRQNKRSYQKNYTFTSIRIHQGIPGSYISYISDYVLEAAYSRPLCKRHGV